MIAPRRLAPLPLLLAGLAVLTLVIALTVHAQSQEVTPNRDATGTNPPAKPTNLQVSAEHDSVTLTWTASTDQTVTHYAILRRNPDVDASQVFHVIESNAGPGTSYTDNSVSASTTYIYRVKSVSPTGVSQWSGYVKAETPAAPTPTPTLTPTPDPEPESTADDQAPTNLAAALAEGGGVTLTWTAPSDDAEGVTGYEILRAVGQGDSTILVADTGSTTTTYTDATATDAGETYAYQVKAIRGEDRSQASGQAQVQVPHDPVDLAPSNLTAALADGGGVNLSWSAPAEDADTVTGYEILRAVGEGDMATLVDDTGNTVTAYTDTTATEAGETYAYKVKAIRGEDRSQASGQARVQVPHDPEDLRPTGLTVGLVENKVILSWTAPAEDAGSVDGYEILRRRPMEGESTLATLVADTESTATTYTDATANEPGVRYVYRIKALRGDDVSLWSNFDKIELPSDYVPDPTPTPEPESTSDDQAPTGLSAALTEGGGVALTWTAPSDDADSVTGYEVLRAVGGGEFTTLAADTASTTTSYTDTTATEAGETYAYQVKAIRGEDRSDASEQAQVQLPHDPVDLAPTGLIAVVLTASVVGEEEDSTQVGLTWSAPAEDADSVTGYEILRAVGDGESATLKADTGSTFTFYTDATATQSGTSYAYRVKAIRGDDRSQASGQAQVQLPHDAVDLAPSDLAAEAVDGGVDLSWSAPAEDAGTVTGYEIMRAVGEGAMATLAADTASTATTYTDATATVEGETYAYQVKAIRDGVRSQASAQASVVRPAAIIVGMCEFDAGGSDLPADTSTACALAVGGSVRGETGAAGDVDWYRVGLQADATYQFDMRGKSTGEWQLVDGVPAFVSAGTLEDPKLLGVYDASGALVPGSNSEVAGTGKDSRIASFSPDAAGVYYISASAESGWTGTYELSVTVTADENAEDLTSLAPSGLEVSMVRNRLTLSWTAPAADAESVTGYEILRGEGEVEPTTRVVGTASTSTSYRDETATQAGVSYTYAVKALRGDEASVESNRASYTLPSGYTAASKELASKVYVHSQVVGETLEFAPQVVVSPDQEPFTIWSGQLNLGLNRAFTPPTNGSLVPNTFTYNGVDYTISALGIIEQYNSDIYDYEYDLFFEISPPIGAENTAAWKFVSAPDDAEFAFADATVRYYDNGQEEYFKWPNSGLSAWYPRAGTPFPVSVTGLPGTDGQEPEVDTTPGIKLSWKTRTILAFGDFQSIPTKVGFTIHRSQRNEWGNFGSGQQQVGEVLKCDIAESGGAQSCLTIGTVGSRVSESWTWTDETAQRGVSYLYTIKPYHEFYSTNRSSVWHGNIIPIVDSLLAAPADRVRIYGQASNVSHRMPHPEAPGTPANLTASQPDSGTCTGSCVRLTWDAAPNAAKYVVFRVGQRTRETWVDNGLTYPQQRFHPADPDLTVPEWEDTSAEPGVNYGYRVAAFNDDGLRSATDAVVGIETLGGTTVPNRVRSLTATATRSSPTSASVVLNWTAPVGQSSVTGYEVQYRLDIPEKAEWDDDWKTLRTEAANAVSSTHTIALEKYYSRRNFYPTGAPTFTGTVAFGQTLTADTSGISDTDGLTNPDFSYQWFLNRALVKGETGSTFGPLTDIQVGGNISLRVSFTDDKGNRESLVSGASPRVDPVEYVPTADKGTLRLNDTENDTDTTNDLVLPFGITYEYRVRAVNGTNKGLPADKEGVRIPNQDGLQSVVIIEFVHQGGCLMWKHSADPDGNEPDGYRLLFASDTRRFHQAKVVVDYVSYVGAPPSPQAVGHCVAPGHLREDWQGYQPQRQASPSTDLSYWIAVQAYDADGMIAKGDGTGGRRSHGSAEIMKWVNKESNENVPPAKGSEAETIGSGEGSQ